MSAFPKVAAQMRVKSHHQYRVEEFLVGIGHKIPDRPVTADRAVLMTWARLLLEETLEWIEAAGLEVAINAAEIHNGDHLALEDLSIRPSKHEPDLVAMADASSDVSVVNTGAMSLNGMADLPLLDEVDANNLCKLATGRLCPETGKFLKAANHVKPDFAEVLRQQGWAG